MARKTVSLAPRPTQPARPSLEEWVRGAAPVEAAPAPADDVPSDDASTGMVSESIQPAPVEEPAEVAPADTVPVEDVPVEDVPVEDVSADVVSADVVSADVVPVDVVPVAVAPAAIEDNFPLMSEEPPAPADAVVPVPAPIVGRETLALTEVVSPTNSDRAHRAATATAQAVDAALALPVPMKRLTIDLPASLHGRLKVRCALDGVQMVDVLRDLIERYVDTE